MPHRSITQEDKRMHYGNQSECIICHPANLRTAVFAKRIHPRNFNFSPKLAAIVGAIIGYDYGVRDARGGYLTSLSITSDGFVMASSTAHGSGALLCNADELDANLALYQSELTADDLAEFARLYSINVKDWRD